MDLDDVRRTADALLIEAKKGTHELELEQAMALSVSGETADEQDHLSSRKNTSHPQALTQNPLSILS
jgi:hypothetical protein